MLLKEERAETHQCELTDALYTRQRQDSREGPAWASQSDKTCQMLLSDWVTNFTDQENHGLDFIKVFKTETDS